MMMSYNISLVHRNTRRISSLLLPSRSFPLHQQQQHQQWGIRFNNNTSKTYGTTIGNNSTYNTIRTTTTATESFTNQTKSSWLNVSLKATAVVISTISAYAIYVEYNANQMSQMYHNKRQVHDYDDDDNNNNIVPCSIVELPRLYNWDALNTYWSHRPISTFYRLLQINYHLLPLLYRYVQDFIVLQKIQQSLYNTSSLNEDHHHQQQQQQQIQLQKEHAIAWRDALTQLGPAFVKAGQQISIRPDLVSPIVLQILQQLCDSVQPISNMIAYQVIQDELQIHNLQDIFIEPPQLVASASLGQVYRGKLKVIPNINTNSTSDNNNNSNNKLDVNSSTGTTYNDDQYIDVAIKVQRPGMMQSFSLDLFLLQRFSILVDFFTSVCTNQPPFHKALYESFACGSYSELDYENEAQNQMYFYNEFKKRSLPVVIPKVYTDYTTRTVLTSEWIDGIKLADAPLEQIRTLIPVGVELFLTQLLDLGTFHADPHVGNLLVQNKTGKLCLIDFGLCATISEKDRRAMTMAIVHIIQRDFVTLIHQDSKELGFLPQDCDTTELYPILTKILTVGLIDNPTSNIHARKRKLLEISNELNDVFFHYPFTVPPYFALITRGLGLLEGIALSGDEDFDIFQAAAPYARRRAMQLLYGRISNNKKNSNTSSIRSTPKMMS